MSILEVGDHEGNLKRSAIERARRNENVASEKVESEKALNKCSVNLVLLYSYSYDNEENYYNYEDFE